MKLPKGFKGIVHKNGDSVKCQHSGKEYKMNNIELSVFDTLSGGAFYRDNMLKPNEMMSDKRYEIEYTIAYLAVWFRENNKDLFDNFIRDYCDWDEEILQFDEYSKNWGAD